MNQNTASAHEEKKKSGRWDDLPAYEVEWLDYDYVTSCEESSKLRDIYTILQSGKEGRYPHLEDFVEKRLLELLPTRERKLWVAQRTEPSSEDKSTAADELASWTDTVSKMDQKILNRSKIDSKTSNTMTEPPLPIDENDIFGDAVVITTNATQSSKTSSKLPPVRNQIKTNATNDSNSKTATATDDGDSDDDSNQEPLDPTSEEAIRLRNEKRRRYGFEYFKEWDKFDPDAELKKMEQMEEKEAAEVMKNIKKHEEIMKERDARRLKELRELGLRDDKQDMSEETCLYVAERERRKGNECFRAKEFDEAYLYYSRSIYFNNTSHITYANRAMVCIRLKKYKQAEKDCTESLTLDSTYTKAISRRGMARHKQGKYLEAMQDFELAVSRHLFKKRSSKRENWKKTFYGFGSSLYFLFSLFFNESDMNSSFL